MKIINNIEQRSDEWFEIRKQYPLTASHAQEIGNQGKGLETLVWEKLSERYSQGENVDYTNEHIERGIELEDLAASVYELQQEEETEKVGFVINEKISKVAGASPDRFVGKDGLLEIKCFADKKHFQMICEGLEIESKYDWQTQMQLLITERKWVDFAAYNPNFKENLLIKRVYPNKEKQDKILMGLKKGEELINNIEKKYEYK